MAKRNTVRIHNDRNVAVAEREALAAPTGQTTERWYIAVAFQTWGRGRTIDEAKRQLKKAGGKLKTYLVYAFDVVPGDKPWIDEMGNSVTMPGAVRTLVDAVKNGKPVDVATVE